MNSSLSLTELSELFRKGCKPREQWRIGTEHEKFGFHCKTLKPLAYDGCAGIAQVLQGLMTFGWQAVYENNNPIALLRDKASITLEPGGQFELSGAPLLTIHETYAETRQHFEELSIINQALDINFLCVGFQPKWPRESMHWMPKSRYAIMSQYMPKVGSHGLDMMTRTATIQANLDFSSEEDMRRKLRIGFCLQPLVTALYASSPFVEGKPCNYLSKRASVWLDTDPARTGIPACIFDDDFGFDGWSNYLLDVPMYFVMRDGKYIDCSGESFRDFLEGKLPQLPHQYPTMDDWELHSSTAFPDVRLKQFIEMRGAAGGDLAWITALPALWKGLLYDPQTLDKVWAWIEDWNYDEVLKLAQDAPKNALRAEFRDMPLQSLCETMLDLSEEGLQHLNVCNALGNNEALYLSPLKKVLDAKQTRADQWLHAYHHEWGESVDPLFQTAIIPTFE
ncbi:MAG: glutamate--cysteine ligase [Mariprofundaceae bacterium]|nr:glutamate--cysteine ligase [Mariprofundaceae bacterium]